LVERSRISMTTEIDIYNGYEGLASLADHAGEIGAGLCKSPRLSICCHWMLLDDAW